MSIVASNADGTSVISVSLGDHAGVENTDADTVRELVAHDLAAHHAPSGSYEVRLGKLGTKVLLVLERRTEQGIEERHTLISGIEEAPIASARVASAMASGKSLEETQNVTNVLTSEARASVQKQGRLGFAGGVVGIAPLGVPSGVGAGAEAGIVYEADHFALTGHGRIAGGGTDPTSKFAYFNLGVGARYFVTESDLAPYIGGGTGFSVYDVSYVGSGNGLNFYGEAGIEAFRTHRTSMTAGLRVDAPLFTLADGSDRKYVLPVSLNVGMAFK
jgi:hypothetical protein